MKVEVINWNRKQQEGRLEAYRKYMERIRKKREVKKCSV